MFGRRKEEMEVMKQTLSCFETSQKNTEIMLGSICELLKSDNKEIRIIDEGAQRDGDFDKRKAAYALNLCMVSVSQIIDYDDINILDQEYETILNNLNLEHMPKDEALLSILKQLLDTITFFRIQDKEKEFIEREYQQKMKNAIWSAVPNFGMIVGTGNPITMLSSLATQVGIGYMNYRKTKAQNMLEKEKQEWQLQRSAMEQLNGLRRELFDASWRMADTYKFPDEYRLTERQITQYNKILMDSDPWRKYERLDAIKEFFQAYPPFWYYFGNAANLIACQARIDNDLEIFCKYRILAIQHFNAFMKINEEAILREDQLASSCALEYFELLDLSIEDNIQTAHDLLDTAVRSSGHACDVLQICALSYLRLGELEPAMKWLSYLVNEGYNTIVNAQLLSSLYACNSINHNDKYRVEYKLLLRKIPERLLFPFPTQGADLDSLKKEFIVRLQFTLKERYAYVIRTYFEMCSIEFNKCVPAPEEDRSYPDSFFSSSTERKLERMNQYSILLTNPKRANDFAARLIESEFLLEYLRVLNKLMNSIAEIIPEIGARKDEILDELSNSVKDPLTSASESLAKIQENLNERFDTDSVMAILDNDFCYYTRFLLAELLRYLEAHVNHLTSIESFCTEETTLNTFCKNHNVPIPLELLWPGKSYDGQTELETEYFSSSLFGDNFADRAKLNALAKRMSKIAVKYRDSILVSPNKHIGIYIKNDEKTGETYKTHRNELIKKLQYANIRKNDIAAIFIDDTPFTGATIAFTAEGAIYVKGWRKYDITAYRDILLENGELVLGDKKYSHRDVNIQMLYDLCNELTNVTITVEQEIMQNYQNAIPGSDVKAITEGSEVIGIAVKAKKKFFGN